MSGIFVGVAAGSSADYLYSQTSLGAWSSSTISTAESSPAGLAVGDFDNDGHVDFGTIKCSALRARASLFPA